MVVNTRRGKKTMDPPMPSKVDVDTRRDDDVVERRREPKNATEREVIVT